MTLPTNIKTTLAPRKAAAFPGASRSRAPRPPVTANATALVRSDDDAIITRQCHGSPTDADLSSLQVEAVRAIRAYVFAVIDHVESLRDGAPAWATAKIADLLHQGRDASERLDDFIEMADRVASLLSGRAGRPLLDSPNVAATTKTQINGTSAHARLYGLSPRKSQVLELLLKGLLNKQIAYELEISEATTKAHVSTILRKLNVSTRTRVIALLANVGDVPNGNLPPKI